MTHVIDFLGAKIDVAIFTEYQKKAMQELTDAAEKKAEAKEFDLDFADTVTAVAKTTGLPAKEIKAFFKARYEESRPKDEGKEVGTKPVINRGELFSVLNSALEK